MWRAKQTYEGNNETKNETEKQLHDASV